MLNIVFFSASPLEVHVGNLFFFCAQYEANGDGNVSLECDIESDSESGSSREP